MSKKKTEDILNTSQEDLLAQNEETKVTESVKEKKPKVKKTTKTEKAETEKEQPKKPTKKQLLKERLGDPNKLTSEDIEKAFDKRKAFMLQDDEEIRKKYKEKHAKTVEGDEAAKGEKAKIREEAKALMTSARSESERILEGYVDGYGKNKQGVYLVNISLENGTGVNQIKIPASQFFFEDVDELLKTDVGETHLRSMLSAHMGAKVKFVIFSFIEKTNVALASRLAAMDILGHAYYQRVGKNGKTRIKEGDIVTARVISVMRDRLVVDCCGTDVVMRGPDLSYTALGILTQEFRVNDTFPVKVMSIGDEEVVTVNGKFKYRKQNITVSRKEVLTNPADKFYDQFNEGDVVRATIKTENTEKGVYVTLQDKINCLCSVVPGDVIRGSKCQVLIKKKYDDHKVILGYILPNTIEAPRTY